MGIGWNWEIPSCHVTSVHGAGNKASCSALLENALSRILCMEAYKGKALWKRYFQINLCVQTGPTDLPTKNVKKSKSCPRVVQSCPELDQRTPSYRDARTHLKMKIWDRYSNFWPIELKFGMQVPFIRPHATVMLGNDPTIFLPTNPTYQKVAYSKIFNLP